MVGIGGEQDIQRQATSDFAAEDILEDVRRLGVPGFGINSADLGLIDGVTVFARDVRNTMTLPHIAPEIPVNIPPAMEADSQRRHPGVERIEFDLVWDPPWQ